MPDGGEKEAALLRVIADVVAAETGARRVPRLRRAADAGDVPGWDSLMHSRIVLALEERLHIRIDIAHTYELRNLGDLVDYLAGLSPRHD